MLKNISKLECQIENKTYQFICDMDAPLTHVKEALFQFLKYVGQIEDAVNAQSTSEKIIQIDKEEVSQ